MGNTRKETKELNTAQDNAATPTQKGQFQQKQSYMQIKSGIWKNDNPCDWLKPNWPKLQAQKPKPAEKPTKTETNWNRRFFNYFGRFRLRLLKIENFGFGWLD